MWSMCLCVPWACCSSIVGSVDCSEPVVSIVDGGINGVGGGGDGGGFCGGKGGCMRSVRTTADIDAMYAPAELRSVFAAARLSNDAVPLIKLL